MGLRGEGRLDLEVEVARELRPLEERQDNPLSETLRTASRDGRQPREDARSEHDDDGEDAHEGGFPNVLSSQVPAKGGRHVQNVVRDERPAEVLHVSCSRLRIDHEAEVVDSDIVGLGGGNGRVDIVGHGIIPNLHVRHNGKLCHVLFIRKDVRAHYRVLGRIRRGIEERELEVTGQLLVQTSEGSSSCSANTDQCQSRGDKADYPKGSHALLLNPLFLRPHCPVRRLRWTIFHSVANYVGTRVRIMSYAFLFMRW